MAKQRVQGTRRLRRILGEAHRQADVSLRQGTEDIAQRILGAQQMMVPVDQGDLRRALTYRVSKTGIQARIGLLTKRQQSDFFYARFLEFGTKGYTGTVRPGLANRRPYTTSIPPMPARPFIGPSFDMYRDDYIRMARKAVGKAIRAVAMKYRRAR